MIYENVELHNIDEVRVIPGIEGVCLQRVPEQVRLCLNEKAQQQMLRPASAEIRFISSGHTVEITLSCPKGICEIIPFWGEFQGKERIQIKNETKTILLKYPDRLLYLNQDVIRSMPFAPRLWRIILRGAPVHFINIKGENIQSPENTDVPSLRYLAYGTSITHGSAATGVHLTYASLTARRLGADLINLGVGGAAYCEPELADYIASRNDWDIASLCLSVNMIGQGFSAEEFEKRVSYMVNRIAAADINRQIFCITIFPHYRDLCPELCDDEERQKSEQFRIILRNIVKSSSYNNIHLVEGPELLKDISGLSHDLLHPADNGMIQIAENLANNIKKVL